MRHLAADAIRDHVADATSSRARAPAASGATRTSLVTDPFTARCVDLMNAVYEVILQVLARYFAHTDETDDQLDVHAASRWGSCAPW